MAVFAVMIRLEYGADYAKRHSETVEKIRKEAVGGMIWEEPTSTFIFRSSKSATALCNDIYLAAPIFESRDLIAVVDLSTKGSASYHQRGAKYPATFTSLMDAR